MKDSDQPTGTGETGREAGVGDRRNFSLCVAVFFTGAVVLVLEILGTKLLSPYFGNNVFVWSALITVTLAALALGYWLGGRLADSRGSENLVDQIMAAAAVWVAVVPELVRWVADPFSTANYQAGLLFSAVVCFGPALFLLGMVTPVAVRLSAPDFNHVGRSAGVVYAWSTGGGILGALGAGFLLLPIMPLSRICHVTALLLLALAATRWLLRLRKPLLLLVPVVWLAAVSGVSSDLGDTQASWADGEFHIVNSQPSYYGTVRVLDWENLRLLLIDGMCHNAQTKSGRELALPYVTAFAAMPYLRPSGRDLLLIGLGGGDVVRLLEPYGIRTTAVEIDPVVADTAFRYFGLGREDVRLVIADGRGYLRRCGEQFNYVALDAYARGNPPWHLFSREAFQEMKARLRPGGLLAVNVAAQGHAGSLVNNVLATLGSVFRHVMVVTTETDSRKLGNVISFASDQPLRLPKTPQPPLDNEQIAVFLERLPHHLIDSSQRNGKVVTDDWNSIEWESAATEIVLRRDNRAVLPASILEP